ncbi:MAG: phage shock protein operon transcriptional activator [Desulfobacteraceae bacterium]|jgi:psp operon transcriptional activator
MDHIPPSALNRSSHATASPSRLPEAIGQSEAFLAFRERLSRVAPIDRPVLLVGERGTGKELAAARLHYLSRRWKGTFVALNCAALAPTLIESELFGYEKGAFTGATQRRTGRFEAADGGTLFLDEIGSIPMEVQEKILRVVEYGGFERVGSSRGVEVDVRIIGATNADLPAMTEKGTFKRDLLDRLSFEVLLLPPLRERQEDIRVLAEHFAARMAFELEWQDVPRFSRDALSELEQYPWPGNVRELKNVVERAVYRSDGPKITGVVFDPFPQAQPGTPIRGMPAPPECPSGEETQESMTGLMEQPLKESVRALEILRIRRALEQTQYRQKHAARLLGLTYHQFRGLLRKHHDALKTEGNA